MKVYSETVFTFIEKITIYAKKILQEEVMAKVNRSRFELGGISYPINFVVFTNDHRIGFYDPSNYQIGLSKKLIYSTKETVIKDVLRHELAHYLTHIFHPDHTQPHGIEFKSVCSRFSWGEDIIHAQIDLSEVNQRIEGEIKAEKILSKVEKLLSLSNSSNIHEAEAATLKANELIIKHNLEEAKSTSSRDEFYAKTVITAKRKNAKLGCIYAILKHFLVNPIFIHEKSHRAIEVSGSLESIELAQYIADFLDNKLENLWKNETQLQGLRAKNSFFTGIADGYDQKITQTKKDLPKSQRYDLSVIEKNLELQMNKIYKRLSYSSSQSRIDNHAFQQGTKKGKNLSINHGIKNKKNKLLSWR